MRFVVDTLASDMPEEIIKGCALALQEERDVSLILCGREQQISNILSQYNIDHDWLEIIDAADVITNEDSPTSAIKTKTESSLVKAYEALKRDDVDGMISSGSTGAVLTGAVLKMGRIRGVHRPALAPLLPTVDGGQVCLIDCGANVDCKPEYLVDFALMGISYMKSVFNIAEPRVGLVCVGVEDHKGNELTKEVFARLKALPINFCGNMEARDALSGKYDVLVCDGFVGNVLLKSVEGTAMMMGKLIKQTINDNLFSKIGALLMKDGLNSLKHTMNYQNKGGAPLLGIGKLIVKGHGAASKEATKAAVKQIKQMYQGNLIDCIKSELAKLKELQENGQNQ